MFYQFAQALPKGLMAARGPGADRRRVQSSSACSRCLEGVLLCGRGHGGVARAAGLRVDNAMEIHV